MTITTLCSRKEYVVSTVDSLCRVTSITSTPICSFSTVCQCTLEQVSILGQVGGCQEHAGEFTGVQRGWHQPGIWRGTPITGCTLGAGGHRGHLHPRGDGDITTIGVAGIAIRFTGRATGHSTDGTTISTIEIR